MKVSVIIPVFHAADYVQQAVASALAQPETGEVILVEDGSADDSLAVCRRLAEQHAAVHLFRHPGGANRGAGASRNLGIEASTCPLVAFLDADDVFLPGRFATAMEVFAVNPDADGVYEITGIFFEDEQSRQRACEAGWGPMSQMGMRRRVDPANLFETLAAGGAGSFCTDGIVVRRDLFAKSGCFNPTLRTGQDTHLWIRMAAVGRLYPGKTDAPVSLCRIHAGNRVTGHSRQNQLGGIRQVWGDLILWGRARDLPREWIRLLSHRYAVAAHGLVMEKRLFGAWWSGLCSCGFLVWHCPQPWRMASFLSLLNTASGIGLALARLGDHVRRRRAAVEDRAA